MNQELKDAIMDAVYVPLERDDMETPCALPFMTSSEHGVCDGEGCPVSDESIASALNAVAKIQTEYYKVKKETQKGTQKEMTNEPSPRPWHTANFVNGIEDANNGKVVANIRDADARLIVDAVNERERLRDIVKRLLAIAEPAVSELKEIDAAVLSVGCARVLPVAEKEAVIREARAALGMGLAPAASAAGKEGV